MPRYTPDKKYRLGDWFLDQRTGSPAWYRCAYDPKTRQLRRFSLRTNDYETAKARFEQWWREENIPREADRSDVTLALVLATYYRDHAANLPTAKAAALHVNRWLDFWGEATLEDVADKARQAQFRAWLGDGKSPAYVQRILSTGKAAINRAEKTGMIRESQAVRVVDVDNVGEPTETKGRPLTATELGTLFDSISNDPLFRFCLLLLGTFCRPEAAYDLRGEQLDFEHRLIALNSPGRRQNKKYRPIIKMPLFIAEHFGGLPNDFYATSWTPNRIGDMKKSFRSAVRHAELEGKVTPYSFRHTGGRWLRAQGVQPWEAGSQTGHRMPGASMLERHYAPASPDYLVNAVTAIDALFDAIKAESARLRAEFGAINSLASNWQADVR